MAIEKRLSSGAVAALAMLALAQSAVAQDDGWSFRVTPYLWLPTITGDLQALPTSPPVDIDFSLLDNLDTLNFGALLSFEGSNGRWGFLTDLIYTDLGTDASTPTSDLFRSADVGMTSLLFSGYGTYSLVHTDAVELQLTAGFRLFYMESTTTFQPRIPAPSPSVSFSETWVDPVVGFRLTVPLSERLFAGFAADVGGFDNELTWQLIGTFGYQISDRWDVRIGYRYIDVDHELDRGGSMDLGFQGVVIGAGYQF